MSGVGAHSIYSIPLFSPVIRKITHWQAVNVTMIHILHLLHIIKLIISHIKAQWCGCWTSFCAAPTYTASPRKAETTWLQAAIWMCFLHPLHFAHGQAQLQWPQNAPPLRVPARLHFNAWRSRFCLLSLLSMISLWFLTFGRSGSQARPVEWNPWPRRPNTTKNGTDLVYELHEYLVWASIITNLCDERLLFERPRCLNNAAR